MGSNIYVILGVSRDADLPRIRRAYRRLVRQYRPALTAGTEVEPTPDERDQDQDQDQVRPAPPTEAIRQVTAQRPVTAPPSRRALALRRERTDSVDEFFGGWVPGILTSGRTASRRKDLYVELILEPDEAARGGLFPLQVPVEALCPACDGSGFHGRIACPECHGGRIDHHEIEISVPPRVRHGQRANLSLEDIGLPDVELNVLVSIARG